MFDQNMDRQEDSGIEVLIVGAGLAGLYAAIECHRQGHSVRVIESRAKVDAIGQFHSLHLMPEVAETRMIRRFCRYWPLRDETI